MAKRFGVFAEDEEKSFVMESIKLANALMLLSRGEEAAAVAATGGAGAEGKVFECKTCSRQFSSFQALGGHRASHKKPRLGGGGGAADAPEKARVHECSVCGLEFAIGQALGGHMRRHRASPEAKPLAAAAEKKRVQIDLNFPPAEWEAKEEVRKLPKLLGFTLTPAMVDCFH